MSTNYQELEKIAQLKQAGVLSDKEFEIEKKKKILEKNKWNTPNFSKNSTNYTSLPTYYERNGTSGEFYFMSEGRISQGEFLLAYIGFWLYTLLLAMVRYLTIVSPEIIQSINTGLLGLIFIFITGFSLVYVYSVFIINIKRLHDINMSGWLSIITVILSPFSTILLLLTPGTNGDNQYGPQR